MTTTDNGHMFFDVLLHFGTLISICIVYWGDIVAMVRELVDCCHGRGGVIAERRQKRIIRRLGFS
jgi:undecaprenyl pyrophosphate phosphatase UppP